jgi:hypothetical protein
MRVLRVAGDRGTNSVFITSALNDGGFPTTQPEVEMHLHYMSGSGKEYVTLTQLDVEGMPKRLRVVLTPRGTDLLEGNIPADPGIA